MTEKPVEALLIGGEQPASPDQVFKVLDRLQIKHSTITHKPMRTVEDSRALRDGVSGGYSKNLFLRNRKGVMVLVTLLEDRMIDLKSLGQQLEIGKPSFASPQRLMNFLGVIPGAVTPLAVINDLSKAVTVVLDKSLLSKNPLHFHPCDNSMTTTIAADDLLKYIEALHHSPLIVDFDELTVASQP